MRFFHLLTPKIIFLKKNNFSRVNLKTIYQKIILGVLIYQTVITLIENKKQIKSIHAVYSLTNLILKTSI